MAPIAWPPAQARLMAENAYPCSSPARSADRDSSAGWGSYEAMLDTSEKAVSGKQFLLGDMFSMADVVFGGTLRYMLRFKMLESRPAFEAYVERISARPAARRADQVNDRAREENGVK